MDFGSGMKSHTVIKEEKNLPSLLVKLVAIMLYHSLRKINISETIHSFMLDLY
jgi:hypothetical protein